LGTLSQYEILYRVIGRPDPGFRILDWGCGNGHFSAYLKYRGCSPVSFSFDRPELVDHSNHVLGDASKPEVLPFQDGSFDLVCSVGVLEHVHETGGSQEKSLQELARVLKPAGTLVIYHFPNQFSWIEFVANLLKALGLHQHYTHTRKFTKRQVLGLFQDWEVSEVRRYGFFPRNIFNRLPGALSTPSLISVYDSIDRLFSGLLPMFCQNYMVIAKKPVSTT
jgi:SAM-dependent methyltransferase